MTKIDNCLLTRNKSAKIYIALPLFPTSSTDLAFLKALLSTTLFLEWEKLDRIFFMLKLVHELKVVTAIP